MQMLCSLNPIPNVPTLNNRAGYTLPTCLWDEILFSENSPLVLKHMHTDWRKGRSVVGLTNFDLSYVFFTMQVLKFRPLTDLSLLTLFSPFACWKYHFLAGNTISWTHKLFRSISWSQSLSFKLNDSFGLCYSDSCKSISVYKNSNTNVRIRLFSWKLHFSSLAIVWSSVAGCTTKFAWVQTKSHILSSWSNCMFSTLCTVEDRLWKCNKQSQKTKMVLPMRQMKCSLFLEKTSCYFWTKHAFRNIWKEFK